MRTIRQIVHIQKMQVRLSNTPQVFADYPILVLAKIYLNGLAQKHSR